MKSNNYQSKLARFAWKTSLTTLGLISICSQQVTANEDTDYVGNRGLEFKEDTTIEFEFIASHGAYQSTFGVLDLDSCSSDAQGKIIFESCDKTPLLAEVKPSDISESVIRPSNYEDDLKRTSYDFVGTPGNTVPEPIAEFTFKQGKKYAFYLESMFDNQQAGVVYSVDFFNNQDNRQALFNEEIPVRLATRRNIPSSEINQFAALAQGGLILRFDDTGSTLVKENQQDVDFDDFVVGIGGYEDCSCSYPQE